MRDEVNLQREMSASKTDLCEDTVAVYKFDLLVVRNRAELSPGRYRHHSRQEW